MDNIYLPNMILSHSEKGVYPKRKDLLPLGANSYRLE